MTTTFLRAAELWVPNADYSLLEFDSGAFGPAKRFQGLTRSMCFGMGEGLPGRTWESKKPVLLPTFDQGNFFRTEAARAAGYSCALAVPWFKGDICRAVLIVFCGHGAARTSALELWHAESGAGGAEDGAMTLRDGAYGTDAHGFAAISRDARFPPGEGLPGSAWLKSEAVFMSELSSTSAQFLRAAKADEAGLSRGLAIPFTVPPSDQYVLTLLANPHMPLAQRIERWAPDESKTTMKRVMAFSELHGGHSTEMATLQIAKAGFGAKASIAEALTSGIPVINDQPATETGAPAAAATSIGAHSLIAIPVLRNGAVSEVVALYI